MIVHTPVSVGELGDKITILRIKLERIQDSAKLQNVQYELDVLESIWKEQGLNDTVDLSELQSINEKLWDIEDQIRNKERVKEFDQQFIEYARAVYFTNDNRAQAKKRINESIGSTLVEEKSYAAI